MAELQEFRAEVRESGFADATDAKIDQWVNRAVREITNRTRWPWREKVHVETAPVATPLVIDGLQHVMKITCGEHVVKSMDRREVLDFDPALEIQGAPSRWYMLNDGIYVWPQATDTLTVFYLCKATVLVDDDDEPDIPSEFDELVVSGARIRGYREQAQAYESLQAEREEWRLMMQEMVKAYRRPNYDNDHQIKLTGGPADYV